MKPATAILLTSLSCSTISCGQTSAPGKADPSLTYEVVLKDPAKYAGRRVTWAGKQALDETTGDAAGKMQERLGFLLVPSYKFELFGVIGEKRPEETDPAKELSRTPGDPGIRKVTGTVSKNTTDFRKSDGTVIKAPVLTDAIVDAPDSETKK